MEFTKKRAILSLTLFTLFFLALSTVSAEILLGQTESLYNLGGNFELTITLSPQTTTSDFLIATLVCGGDDVEIFKSPFSVSPDAEKEVQISTNLDKFLVSDMKGDCYVKAKYGEETANSPKFEISDEITVTLTVEGVAFNPEDRVNVNGQAIKANGVPLEGFVELSVPDIDFSITDSVTAGVFEVNFTVPSDAPAGSYKIVAKAYDRDSSQEIINEGEATSAVRINQVIKEVAVALDKQSLLPTENLEYTVLLYDQAKDTAEFDVSVSIYKPDNTLFEKKIIKAGAKSTIDLKTTSEPGYWKIESSYNELKTTKDFLVEEYRDVYFDLNNQTLMITNIGNVPYVGPVQVVIGDVSEIKEVNLDLSETIRFKLGGPDGSYMIAARKGSEEVSLGTTFLTGKAISVNESDKKFFGSNLVVLLGLIIILVLAIVLVFVYKKYSRRRSLLGGSSSSDSSNKPTIPSGQARTPIATVQTQHVIDKGEKQEAAIISLKLRNLNTLSEDSKKSIDSALWKAKEAGAKIYSDGEFRIIILSQALTREKDNAIKAVEIAQSIERILKAYNRRSAQKIDFGIGVNHGALIVESVGGKFRFMSLNNIVSITKRMSDNSNEDILISESLHRKSVGRVKAEKLKDKNLWKVDKVTDRALHSDYVRTMSSRHKEEESKGHHHRR